jgi:hypothetical protein
MKYGNQGLQFVLIDLSKVKLVIFINSSFTNNYNLSLQISFIITLVNKERDSNAIKYKIYRNILH